MGGRRARLGETHEDVALKQFLTIQIDVQSFVRKQTAFNNQAATNRSRESSKKHSLLGQVNEGKPLLHCQVLVNELIPK